MTITSTPSSTTPAATATEQAAVEVPAVDEAALNAFLGQIVTDLGASLHALTVVIGDKLGLFRALAEAGPSTSDELAAATDTAERYVREWLRGQAAGNYVRYDPATDRYWMTPEQACVLGQEDSPAFAAGAFWMTPAVARNQNALIEAFRTGGGFGWGQHDPTCSSASTASSGPATLSTPPALIGQITSTPEEPLRALDVGGKTVAYAGVMANLTGNSAMSMPLYWNEQGLPIGVHVLGRYGDEATLFRLAGQLEIARPWTTRQPPNAPPNG